MPSESVNARLRDAAVSHSIYLERYKAGVVRQMLSILDQADNDIVALIQRRNVDQLAGQERLEKLLRAILQMSKNGTARYTQALRGSLEELAAYEIEFQTRSIRRLIPDGVVADLGIVAPSTGTVYAAAMARPFAGRLLREWTQSLERAKYIAIRDAVRMGVVEGETVDQIVRRVRGTKARKYRDGVMAMPRHQAEAVVRTAVNHTASMARDQLYKANADLVKGWQFVATLDARTTPECQSLDGEVFPVSEGPRPPRHVNCRSTSVPVLKSWRELGIDRDELAPGTRASMNGQVPETMTYGEWLKGQPVAVQNEVLGKSRAQLFRGGGLTVDRFSDARGRRYTLAELRSREAAAFERAGL